MTGSFEVIIGREKHIKKIIVEGIELSKIVEDFYLTAKSGDSIIIHCNLEE